MPYDPIDKKKVSGLPDHNETHSLLGRQGTLPKPLILNKTLDWHGGKAEGGDDSTEFNDWHGNQLKFFRQPVDFGGGGGLGGGNFDLGKIVNELAPPYGRYPLTPKDKTNTYKGTPKAYDHWVENLNKDWFDRIKLYDEHRDQAQTDARRALEKMTGIPPPLEGMWDFFNFIQGLGIGEVPEKGNEENHKPGSASNNDNIYAEHRLLALLDRINKAKSALQAYIAQYGNDAWAENIARIIHDMQDAADWYRDQLGISPKGFR